MKNFKNLCLFVFIALGASLCDISQLCAEEVATQSSKTPAPATSAKRGILFTPPLRGAPETRVGGGTRGGAHSADKPVLAALVPSSTGFTTQESPTFYWFQSKPVKGVPLKLTLNGEDDDEPALEVQWKAADSNGIQAISLATRGVKLKMDKQYEWNVAIVYDPNESTQNLLSSGTIKFVACPETLKTELAGAEAKDRPLLYAAAGLWYDALKALSDLIDASRDKKMIELRADLMEQVGLQEIAQYERDRIK